MKLTYLFFGSEAGQPLPLLDGFKVAKHTKANAQGVKKERTAIRIVPKSRFKEIATTRELIGSLFGLLRRADEEAIKQLEAATAVNAADDV
jgi:hypothetical protein